MKLNKQFVFPITEKGAEECSALLESLPSSYYKDASQLAEMKSLLQELILDLHEHYGKDDENTFSISVSEGFRKLHFYIHYKGTKYDPRITSGTNDEYSELAENIISKYSLFAADYHYSDGENIIHAVIEKKHKINSFHRILIALFLGIILGITGKLFSSSARSILLEILGTFKTTILNLIIMSSTLTVFTMVVNSISDFKSIRSVKKTGLGILKYHMLNYIFALLCILVFTFQNLTFTSRGNSTGLLNSLAELSSLLSDLLPKNYISPLADCNFLHIIIIAFLLGFAILSVGEGAKPVREFFHSAELVSNRILGWFTELIPLFLFAMIPSLMWSQNLSLISDVFIYLLFIILSILLSALFFLVYMCIRTKLPFFDSFKKIFPAMLQGFLTANSSLSVPEIQAATKRFGVKDSFNGYSTAVGFVFSHVGIMIMELVLVFGLLPVSNIAVTIPATIRIILAAWLFSFAVPPTSGGIVAVVTILFEMVGIGDNYLALVAPVLLVADFFETSTRCGEIVMGTVLAAKKMGKIE